MEASSPDYYRFVQCPVSACRLRFPGVVGVPCPLCKEPTVFVSERANFPAPSATQVARPIEILLDNIRSVFNVGSIFRSSEGCGAAHLYLCGITPTPAHAAMKKTALGAEELVAWSGHRNGPDLAEKLVQSGRILWALEYTEDSENLFALSDVAPDKRVVLVLGNEVTGVDPGILQHCERTLYIPMRGHKASLNVATAMGIAGYALVNDVA